MEGAVDVRLLVTIAGILFSVAGAAAIARFQIKSILESLTDIEKRLRSIDQRIDLLESSSSVVKSRVDTLSEINSVSALASYNSKITRIEVLLEETRKAVDMHRNEYLSAHNGRHPSIE